MLTTSPAGSRNVLRPLAVGLLPAPLTSVPWLFRMNISSFRWVQKMKSVVERGCSGDVRKMRAAFLQLWRCGAGVRSLLCFSGDPFSGGSKTFGERWRCYGSVSCTGLFLWPTESSLGFLFYYTKKGLEWLGLGLGFGGYLKPHLPWDLTLSSLSTLLSISVQSDLSNLGMRIPKKWSISKIFFLERSRTHWILPSLSSADYSLICSKSKILLSPKLRVTEKARCDSHS